MHSSQTPPKTKPQSHQSVPLPESLRQAEKDYQARRDYYQACGRY